MSNYQEGYGNYPHELPMKVLFLILVTTYQQRNKKRIEMNEDLCIIDDERF